jgi:CHAT domain-containing protein
VKLTLRLKWIWLILFTGFCVVSAPAFGQRLHSPAWVAQTTQNAPDSAERLDQQGRTAFAAGQFTEAAIAFQQAAQLYQTQGDSLKQAVSLSNLALAQQQLGHSVEANQAIADSLKLLETEAAHLPVLAQALDVQGTLQLAQGKAEAALATWERTASLYDSVQDPDRATQSRINQAQALQTLGLYRRANAMLQAVLGLEGQTDFTPAQLTERLQTLPTSKTTAAALSSFGETLRVLGNLEQSQQVLQQGLAMAQTLQQPEAIALAQFNLGNTIYAQALATLSLNDITPTQAAELFHQSKTGRRFQDTTEVAEAFYREANHALEFYKQAVASATSPVTQSRAQLNQLRLLVETEQTAEVQALLPQIQQQIQSLPASRMSLDAQINFAQILMKIKDDADHSALTTQLLKTAIQQARDLQDLRAESYALGLLGEQYEQAKQWENAQTVTQRALFLAQSIHASEITYRWQWQLGRLLQATEKTKEAIVAYTEAVKTLQSIRSDLAAITPEEQFSFRDTVEPMYRQLVGLLLESTESATNLTAARQVIESLQLAELDNFFREACLNASPVVIDQIDRQAAVLYPIVLPDRLAMIASLPQTNSAEHLLRYYSVATSQAQVESTVSLLRDSLDQPNDDRFLAPAQQLYDWLIRPVKTDLDSSSAQTLVFVLDGALRNIPMAVLHDGQQYLAESPYSIALTPGLQLLGTQTPPKNRSRALVGGLSEARSGFSALPNVNQEVQTIATEFPDSQNLINQDFTNAKFQSALDQVPFSVVHLATHGKFSSQFANTYVLTWDGRLDVNQLRTVLQSNAARQGGAIDLLVLSACETAVGDRQATLGLAGMAVRAGASSTIATLWQVNDQSSSELMSWFYQEFVPGNRVKMTKAAALHHAQQKILQQSQYRHPYFWAAYVLVGNWQ